jgi:DNA-3-methyladenine glycosylase
MRDNESDDFLDFLNGPAVVVAKQLLGCVLVREHDGHVMRAKIVETEAYDASDAASHSFKGPTPRTQVMFGPSGYAYVYFTYGMHYCMNIVTGKEGEGSAVLIRAVEPISGHEQFSKNRKGIIGPGVSNGPAKLCQAMGIDKRLDSHDLRKGVLRLVRGERVDDSRVVTTTRIGISQSSELPWRFYIKDNPYVSKK